MFRFRNHHKIANKPYFFTKSVDPRLQQIFMPLMSVVDDLAFHDELEDLAHECSRQIAVDRGLDVEAQMLTAIRASEEGTRGIALKDVTRSFKQLYGTEYDDRITPRWVGAFIRRKLNLTTHKSNGNYVIPFEEAPRLCALYQKYGTEEVSTPSSANGLPTIQS